MATVSIYGDEIDIELAIFDKDGTLIEFHGLWGHLHQRFVAAILAQLPQLVDLEQELHRTLGFDWQYQVVVADSPLAVASNLELATLAAGCLYRGGLNWTAANAVVAQARAGSETWRQPELIQPLGAVHATLQALRGSGVRIAVATSDDRAASAKTLTQLGVAHLVDILICGDDPLPQKPDPAGYHHICNHLNVAPEKTLMVGDTLNDIRFGQNGGAAATLGISGGAGNADQLSHHATWTAPSIDVIQT